MKQLATIGIVVLLLIGTAFYFQMNKTDDTKPVVTTPEQPLGGQTPPSDVPTPNDKGESAGTLTLRTALSHGYMLPGTQDVFATIDIEGIDQAAKERPPLNLAVVIDRSGSMSGQKMSSAKSAAVELVNRLSGEDRLAIVSYSGDARVEYSSQRVTPNNRGEMIRAIQRIRPLGATNISDGMMAAQKQLRKWNGVGGVNRIILISDGRPTNGYKGQTLVNLATNTKSAGTSVSTIGVGLDYNENLMTHIAKQGTGNYYFVDQPQQIYGFLTKEITGLTSIIARNTKLAVTLADHVQLAELRGFAFTRTNNTLIVDLSEFSRKERKNVVLSLKPFATEKGLKPILDVKLSYEDEVNAKPALQNLALSSVVTDNTKLMASGPNLDVVGRVQAVTVAAEVDKAMDLWDKGETEAAEKTIRQTRKKLNRARREFKFDDDAKYESAAQDLGRLQNQVTKTPASAPEAKRRRKKAKSKSLDLTLGDSMDMPSYAE